MWRATSDAFIQKYFPDIFGSLEFTGSDNYATPYYYSPAGYYSYSRLYKGYRFDGNTVNVSVNAEDIKVSLEKQGNFEVLEVNIVMPEKGSRA